MRLILVLLTAAVSLTACDRGGQSATPQPEAAPPAEAAPEATPELSESERLNAWFEERYEEQLQQSPIQLTFLGRKERYDEVDDFSEAEEDRQLDWLRGTVEEMKRTFDYSKLTPEAQISYDVWEYQYQDAARVHDQFSPGGRPL
jgi:uncharacterized protein (DUF885 family)